MNHRRVVIPVPVLVRRRRRGMGEDDDSGSLIFGGGGSDGAPPAGWSAGASAGSMLPWDPNDPWQGTTPPSGSLGGSLGAGAAGSYGGSSSSGSGSGGNSSSWLSNFLNNSFGLASKTLTPPNYEQKSCTSAGCSTTTIRGGTTGGTLAGNLSVGGSSSMLFIGLGAVALVAVLAAGKK